MFYTSFPQIPRLNLLPETGENVEEIDHYRRQTLKWLGISNAVVCLVCLLFWLGLSVLRWGKTQELDRLVKQDARLTQLADSGQFNAIHRKRFVKSVLDRNVRINNLLVRLGRTIPQETWLDKVEISAEDLSKAVLVSLEGKALTLDMVNKMPSQLGEVVPDSDLEVSQAAPLTSPDGQSHFTWRIQNKTANLSPAPGVRIAMMRYLKRLQGLRWKHGLHLLIRVFSDFRNAGLLALLLFVAWGIGWETVLHPGLQAIGEQGEVIQTQKKAMAEKRNLQKRYDFWGAQLKDLTHDLIPVGAEQSIKVLSVSESGELLKMARGELRQLVGLQPLQPPHQVLENVSVTPAANSATDLLSLLEPSSSSQPAQSNAATKKTPAAATSGLPVERYDYDLKATGTYAAIADFINQLTLYPRLVRINRIVIARLSGGNAPEPDPKAFPDYPVKLDMTLSVSLFFHAATKNR